MNIMAGKKWTEKDNGYLVNNYSTESFEDLENYLGRTRASIIIQASKLGVKREVVTTRFGDVSPLLADSYEAYYWMGFIAADGTVLNNSRLKVSLSIKDSEHLKVLSYLLGTNLNLYENKCAIAIQDRILIPKLCKKFDLRKKKTYNPPSIKIESDCLFLSFLAGFIDGDGSFRKLTGRKDVNLVIKLHSSWLDNLIQYEDRVYEILKVNKSKRLSKINGAGYAELTISDNSIIRELKNRVLSLNLPIMNRKWDRVDCSLISRYKSAEKKRKNVCELYQKGFSMKEISNELSIPYGTVYSYIKGRG